jgi:hypothetical protein
LITETVICWMKRRRASYIKMLRRQKTLPLVVSRETMISQFLSG